MSGVFIGKCVIFSEYSIVVVDFPTNIRQHTHTLDRNGMCRDLFRSCISTTLDSRMLEQLQQRAVRATPMLCM